MGWRQQKRGAPALKAPGRATIQKVSVIIPAWQAQEHIGRCLKSVAWQSVLPHEILIGIDGCEKTLQALELPVDLKARTKVFWFPENVGCYVVRNTLAEKAEGDALMFFDADDEMCPNYIESMVNVLKRTPKCVARAVANVVKNDRVIEASKKTPMQLALRKDLFLTLKGLEAWKCAADTQFKRYVVYKNIPLILAPSVNCIMHRRPGSLTTRPDTGTLSDLREFYHAQCRNFSKDPKEKAEMVTADCERLEDFEAKLYVSLTSHPARFPFLKQNLDAILNQDIKPEKTILWLAPEDMAQLPKEIINYPEDVGLDILTCEDYGPATKLIPMIQKGYNEKDIIVTADDDEIYPSDWLSGLVSAWKQSRNDIIAHIVRRVPMEPHKNNSVLRPYRWWSFSKGEMDYSSHLNFALGWGGVLYPPGCFDPEVLNLEAFQRLCPRADDIWFHWMTRRAGFDVLWTGKWMPPGNMPKHIPGSQEKGIALKHGNVPEDNDIYLKQMIEAYGNPWNQPPKQPAR